MSIDRLFDRRPEIKPGLWISDIMFYLFSTWRRSHTLKFGVKFYYCIRNIGEL